MSLLLTNRIMYQIYQNTIFHIIAKLQIWCRHPYAIWILAAVSFAESSFFLVPPDVMLLPMCLLNPKKAWIYALTTTCFSVLGGIFGYIIGFLLYEIFIEGIIINTYYYTHLLNFQEIYEKYGVISILIAGFTPIPYKIATITTGILAGNIITFTLASFVSRGLRFFLIATLSIIFEKKGKALVMKHFKIITILVSILIFILVLGYITYRTVGN